MIDFQGKQGSIDLMNRLELAGCPVHYLDNQPVCPDVAAAQAIIDAFTLQDALNNVNDRIDAYAKSLRDSVVDRHSMGEIGLWATKYDQSKKFLISNLDSDAPRVVGEAAHRGITTAAMAAKIIANGDALTALEDQIAGIAGKHWDNVRKLTTFEDVSAYDITTDWPVV